MLVAQSRPRNLRSYHAASLLFGDWGTSRLYVLGLAFYYTAHASVLFMAVMSVLMVAVAWAYTIICRAFPEGGGVYAIARLLSRTLSVVGGTLLLCNFTVTAGLSTVESLHYFGIPHSEQRLTAYLSALVLLALGVVNWFGARNAGRFALIVAVAAVAMSALVALLAAPFLPDGLTTISWGHPSLSGWPDRWQAFVNIVLALSGVEAVANMTGLMKPPVARTAKRTIWPVLAEVVTLNMVFAIALSGLPALTQVDEPHHQEYQVRAGLPSADIPHDVKEYRDTAVKVLAVAGAERLAGPGLASATGIASGIVFGMLLLSAANTAIMAMVSVLYAMAQDKELPQALTKLNYSGVPWMGLLLSCAMPVSLVLVVTDVAALADLYAIGVCGAITISVLGCVVNPSLPIHRAARLGMGAVGMVMLAIETTIIITKPDATLFAGAGIAAVLGTRHILAIRRKPAVSIPEPEKGWVAEVKQELPPLDPRRPRIMLAARGRYQSEFAVDLARRRGAVLFAIYVRTLRVMDIQPGKVPRIEDDPIAQEALGTTVVLARAAGVPVVPIYITGTDIAAEILDYTVTYGCDTLIMGKSRRSLFSRALAGDVVAQVYEHLPSGVTLVTRSPDTPFVPGQPTEELRRPVPEEAKEQAPPT